MQFLKQIDADLEGGQFKATFWNGKTTDNYDVACFFMSAQDRNHDVERVRDVIGMARQVDPTFPWDEVERILEDERTN